jgi:multidrug resistance efflux pump
MAEHNLSWDQVVQMCRQAHLEDEQLVANGFQAEQLDLEAAEAEVAEAEVAEAEGEAAEPTQGCERLSEARAEIADARAELADARRRWRPHLRTLSSKTSPPTMMLYPAASSASATSGFCSRPSRP